MEKEINAAKVVSSAILGYDFKPIVVGGRSYVVYPPTIHRLAGAAYWLTDINEAETLKGAMQMLSNTKSLCKALSFFIQGDESLGETLAEGTIEEVTNGLEAAFSLIDIRNFQKLSALMRSAKRLIARPR